MRPQHLMTAAFIFMVGTCLSCICSGRWLSNGEYNIINALASFNVVDVTVGGVWTIPKGVTDFFSAIVTALGWQYPYLSSPWCLTFKWFLWLVSIGTVWGIVEAFIWVMNSLVSVARSIIGAFT